MAAPAIQFPILDSAIGQFEGFGKPGTLATINNNPGNIIPGDFATSHGAIGTNKNFAVFPDVATGVTAEDALVKQYSDKGYSISDLISTWSPPSAPGNSAQATQDYINFVSGKVGLPATSPLSATATPQPVGGITASDIAGTVAQAALDYMTGSAASMVGVSWGRIGAFILGLILIAGGLYLFKPVQEVVNNTGRAAGKALLA